MEDITTMDELKVFCNSEIKDKTMVKSSLHPTDVGFDLACNVPTIRVPANGKVIISTGLYMAIPSGYAGFVWSRSGLSAKYDLEVGAGCIDPDYRGEVKVILYNHGATSQTFNMGDRIAQIIFIKVENPKITFVNSIEELGETNRPEGFGSTGV